MAAATITMVSGKITPITNARITEVMPLYCPNDKNNLSTLLSFLAMIEAAIICATKALVPNIIPRKIWFVSNTTNEPRIIAERIKAILIILGR